MRLQILLVCLLVSNTLAAQWAVIVVGSNGFWNYRHQADGCHAYQSLRAKGIPAENIIQLNYDDVAHNANNPFPGKLFNKPDPTGPGKDVYAGCEIDYKGKQVTPKNFLAVITGDHSAVSGQGTGRVLKSTADDYVFINYVDHGGKGIVGFPAGEGLLYATDLNDALKEMHSKKMYKKLVFYMEACESGSMFEGRLPDNIEIYATTAANGKESSWGTYCGSQARINHVDIGSCLGDLYSVNWMEDLDSNDGSETLQEQYQKVKKETSQSHVLQFGDLSFVNDPINEFEGPRNAQFYKVEENIKHETIASRDTKLHFLYQKFVNSSFHASGDYWSQELQREIRERTEADALFHKFSELVFGDMHEEMMEVDLPAQNMDCLKLATRHYEEKCTKFNEYSLKYVNIFNTVCMTSNFPQEQVVKYINQVCP